MSVNPFQKATKQDKKLKIALAGISGSGKTMTALALATGITPAGKRIALVDTENKSASLYSDRFDFDTISLTNHHPKEFIKLIDAAIAANYGVIILDSITHAYDGINGYLQLVDSEAIRLKGDKFGAFRVPSEIWKGLLQRIVNADINIIITMRSKTKYVIEDGNNSRKTIKKMGMEPIIKENFEYEFDIFGELDIDHHLTINKTRLSLLDNKVFGGASATIGDFIKLGVSISEFLGTENFVTASEDVALKQRIEAATIMPVEVSVPKIEEPVQKEQVVATEVKPKPSARNKQPVYINKEDIQEIAQLAFGIGHTKETAQKVINSMGIASLDKCPESLKGVVISKLTDKGLLNGMQVEV